MRVREAELQFPSSGLVCVTGPIGSGKTSLGEAFCRTLFGSCGRYTDTKEYSFDEEGDTLVSVTAELDNRPLVVELGYKHGSFDGAGEGLRFTFEGAKTERPKAAQTRQELAEILRVAPDAAPWTVFLDGERLKFNKLSQADALSLLLEAMNQPHWDIYHGKAKAMLAKASGALGEACTSRDWAVRDVESAEQELSDACESAKAARAAYDADMQNHAAEVTAKGKQVLAAEKALQHAYDFCNGIKRDIKRVQDEDAAELGKIELELSRLQSERAAADRVRSQWAEEKAKLNAEVQHARQHRAGASAKVCPSCRRPLSEPLPESTIKTMDAKVAEAEKALRPALTAIEECDALLAEIDHDIAVFQAQKCELKSNRLDKLSDELAVAESKVNIAMRAHAESEKALVSAMVPPSDSQVVQANKLCEVREVALTGCKLKLAEITTRAAGLRKAAKIAEYWVRGFSPEGIPNRVLRSAIKPLNESARLISEAISGGAIKVEFSAEAELASGIAKPKLVTRVINETGAKKLAGNSKGESGLANLIIAETQARVGRVLHRVGFRWFDETLNSQDPTIRKHFYSYLKRQCAELGVLTFVVDHNPEAWSYADHVLEVSKDGGFTQFAWKQ